MSRRTASDWSVKEVCDWLQQLEMGQYCPAFESLSIDGGLLFEINEHDLETDLKVKVRLHRVKILDSVKKLKARESAPVPPEESADISEANVYTINVTGTIPSPRDCSDSHCDVLILKAIEGPLISDIFIVGAAGATFGRHTASNDIVISESFVSRRHCNIKYSVASNQFLLEDVGSTTGTFLMLQRPTALVVNMMFQMGLSEFRVDNIKYSPSGAMVAVDLTVFEGPARQTVLKVGREGLRIGREGDNGLAIREDSQISSHHGQILLTDGQFVLSDLNSTNKTWIRLSLEGEESQPCPLVIGDVIKIGITVMMVMPPEEMPQLVEAKSAMSEEQACKICYTRESNVALYPCGHMMCHPCAKKCKKCPICRREFADVVVLNRQ